MSQSEYGKIHLFEDFFQVVPVAHILTDHPLGGLRLFGQGINEADSGAAAITGVASGAVRVTTTNEAAHSAAVGTQQAIQPSSMGPVLAECRIQLNNLDTKNVFFGLSDDGVGTAIEPVAGSSTTLTLNDSDLVGFVLDHDLTEDEMWHFTHNGGSAAGETTSSNVESSVDAVAGEWDVLRVEVDSNGTARWYINGDLKKTLANAVDPDAFFAVYAMVTADGAAVEEMDLDYIGVRCNRDWSR